jgi:hypothetical protein
MNNIDKTEIKHMHMDKAVPEFLFGVPAFYSKENRDTYIAPL